MRIELILEVLFSLYDVVIESFSNYYIIKLNPIICIKSIIKIKHEEKKKILKGRQQRIVLLIQDSESEEIDRKRKSLCIQVIRPLDFNIRNDLIFFPGELLLDLQKNNIEIFNPANCKMNTVKKIVEASNCINQRVITYLS